MTPIIKKKPNRLSILDIYVIFHAKMPMFSPSSSVQKCDFPFSPFRGLGKSRRLSTVVLELLCRRLLKTITRRFQIYLVPDNKCTTNLALYTDACHHAPAPPMSQYSCPTTGTLCPTSTRVPSRQLAVQLAAKQASLWRRLCGYVTVLGVCVRRALGQPFSSFTYLFVACIKCVSQ